LGFVCYHGLGTRGVQPGGGGTVGLETSLFRAEL